MNYERNWESGCNAAGFAAECARLALRFYVGDKRSDVITAIEVAERYVAGEQIDRANINDAAYLASRAARSIYEYAYTYVDDGRAASSNAAESAANAAYVADAARTVVDTGFAATYATQAGVDTSEIQIAYARWVTRDLIGDRSVDDELRQAAGAAIVAGDEDLARELLQ